jgi:hypothetical protein
MLKIGTGIGTRAFGAGTGAASRCGSGTTRNTDFETTTLALLKILRFYFYKY